MANTFTIDESVLDNYEKSLTQKSAVDYVKATTLEDSEQTASIAAGLEAVEKARQKEAPGLGPMGYSSKEELAERSRAIQEAIGKLPGEEVTLGLGRTLYSIAKFLPDMAFGVGYSVPAAFNEQKYEDYYNKLRKEDDNPVWAGIQTVYKAFREAPELPSEGEAVKAVIDALSDKPEVITEAEAEKITGFFRPGVSTTEQVIRSIPEVGLGTLAGVKFLARNQKKIIKEAEEFLAKQTGKKSFNIAKASNEQIIEAVTDQVNNKLIKPFRGVFFKERAAINLQIAREGGFKNIFKKISEKNDEIRDAKDIRGKLEAKVLGLKKGKRYDKAVKSLDEQNKKITLLRTARRDLMPKAFVEIPITEAGAVAGSVIAGNYFGEDSPYATIGGALTGGIFSGMALNAVLSTARGASQFTGAVMLEAGSAMGSLTQAEKDMYLKRGIVGGGANINRKERKILQRFSRFIMSLPERERNRAFDELAYFKKVKEEVSKIPGIDQKLIETTLGNAMNFPPLMLMRESISQYKLSASKKLDKVDRELAEILETQSVAESMIATMRMGLDKLASQVSESGQDAPFLTQFINNLDSLQINASAALKDDRRDIDDVLAVIEGILSQQDIVDQVRNKDALYEALEQLNKTKFVRELPEEARKQVSQRAKELQDLYDNSLTGVENHSQQLRVSLKEFGQKYYVTPELKANKRASADQFAHVASDISSQIRSLGKRKFEELDEYYKSQGVKVDATNWFRSLYDDVSENNITKTYEVVIPTSRNKKLKQIIAKSKIRNSELDELANLQGKTSVEEVLNSNPEFQQVIYDFMKDGNFSKLDQIDLEEGISFQDVKDFISISNKETADDFAVFKLIDDIATEFGFQRPKIELDVIDIHNFSKSFGKSSANFYDSDRALAVKYSQMREGVLDTLDTVPGAKDKIQDAKTFWLNNVVKRYRNKENNSIGWNLDHKIGEDYIVDPVKWIDMNAVRSGDTTLGESLEKQLNLTFGDYDPATKTYVIPEDRKEVVRGLMNNLLIQNVYDSDVTEKARRLGRTTVRADKPEELARGLDEQRQLALSAGNIKERSAAINHLQEKGLIDATVVEEYARDIGTFLGEKGLQKQLKKNDTLVGNKLSQIRGTLDDKKATQEAFMRKTAVSEGAAKITDEQTLVDFFVVNPQGPQRVAQIVPQIAKEMGKSEQETKKILSDLVLKGISKLTQGEYVDVGAGEAVRSFNSNDFFALIKDNEEALKAIMEPETFSGVQKLAEFMRILARDETARSRAAGVSVSVPQGLSMESMLSRVYSISRGVVSPQFVATEVALRKIRKTNAQAFAKIASDPKMVDAMIEMIERGDTAVRKYNTRLFNVLLEAQAEYVYEQRSERMQSQAMRLDLEKFKLGAQ